MFPLLSKIIDRVVLISEPAARKSIKRIANQNNLVVEGSGGLSVAAALSIPQDQRGKSVCILSGSAIEPSAFADIMSNSED